MPTSRRQFFIRANKIFDTSVMLLAFFLASLVVVMMEMPDASILQLFATRIKIQNFFIIALLYLSWPFIFQLVGIYRSRRIGSRFQDIIDILKVTTIATFLLFVASFIFNIQLFNKTFFAIFWTVSSSILIISRIALHFLLKKLRIKGKNSRQMLIIGTGKRAQDFAEKIAQRPELGYHILGFVDDQWEGLDTFYGNGGHLLGNLSEFQLLLKTQVIDEVVLCLPVKSYYDKITAIISICEEKGIIIRFLSDLFELKIAKAYIDQLEDNTILTLHSAPIEQWPLLVKRAFDVVFSLTLLVLLSPLLCFVAFLIKIESKGPVFFIQERVGLNNRKFKLIKFRTMVENAETLRKRIEKLNEVSGPVFKIRKDPRLTSVGKYLRKMSIDELPQLINVLKGDMSLVGPRPPIQSEVEQYQWQDRRRLSMKPGITCLWQINGRNNIPFERWMELDKEYIDNWSFGLDLKILLKTIPAVIRGSGAA